MGDSIYLTSEHGRSSHSELFIHYHGVRHAFGDVDRFFFFSFQKNIGRVGFYVHFLILYIHNDHRNLESQVLWLTRAIYSLSDPVTEQHPCAMIYQRIVDTYGFPCPLHKVSYSLVGVLAVEDPCRNFPLKLLRNPHLLGHTHPVGVFPLYLHLFVCFLPLSRQLPELLHNLVRGDRIDNILAEPLRERILLLPLPYLFHLLYLSLILLDDLHYPVDARRETPQLFFLFRH